MATVPIDQGISSDVCDLMVTEEHGVTTSHTFANNDLIVQRSPLWTSWYITVCVSCPLTAILVSLLFPAPITARVFVFEPSLAHLFLTHVHRLGCNVSRLRDFIAGFYSSQDDHPQHVDDAFCAFVWSLVVQQPSVRVGTLPPGSISEVYIAPQTSARRKAAAKGEELTEGAPSSLVLVEDARHRHLEDLRREYGDHLRIAVDPETSFAAITGSHIRVRAYTGYNNASLIFP